MTHDYLVTSATTIPHQGSWCHVFFIAGTIEGRPWQMSIDEAIRLADTGESQFWVLSSRGTEHLQVVRDDIGVATLAVRDGGRVVDVLATLPGIA